MIDSSRAAALAAGAALALTACASTYDADLARRRTESLYGATSVAVPADDSTEPPETQHSESLESADLDECLRYGLAHSADLRAAFERWRAATERVEQVSTLPDPRLTYGEFLEEIQTRTGAQERRLGLSQAFPWPGELAARGRVAERRAEAEWQAVEFERLRVAAAIEVAFHEYAFLARELALTREVQGLLRGLEPVVQARVRAGAGQDQLLRLQVELGRVEDDVASLELRRPVLSARLAQVLNLRATGDAALTLPQPVLREPKAGEFGAIEASVLFERALEANPHLARLARELAASREAESLAGFKRRPSFAVGVDTIQTSAALSPTTPGSGDDPVVLNLSLSLPIWRSSYAAAEREARHLVHAARQQLDSAEVALRADIEGEVYRSDDAARRLALQRDSLIPRAKEALDLTLVAYRAGNASVLDLIDSERALLAFELARWRACRDLLQARARLRVLIGGDL